MIYLGSIFHFTLVIGMPIAIVLGISALGYFYFTRQAQFPIILPQQMLAGIDMFVLLAIPLFCAGGLDHGCGRADPPPDRFRELHLGRFRDGLSLSAVWGYFLFGGVNGSDQSLLLKGARRSWRLLAADDVRKD